MKDSQPILQNHTAIHKATMVKIACIWEEGINQHATGKSRGLDRGRRVRDEKNSKNGGRTLKETKEKIKANSKQLPLQMTFICMVRSELKENKYQEI